VNLSFKTGEKEERLAFDPEKPFKPGLTVKETCEKCHRDVLASPSSMVRRSGSMQPLPRSHASNYPSWTRNQSWRQCTTCHAEKKTGVHVIAGFVHGVSHPRNNGPIPHGPAGALPA